MIKDQIFWWIESNLQFKAEKEWRFLRSPTWSDQSRPNIGTKKFVCINVLKFNYNDKNRSDENQLQEQSCQTIDPVYVDFYRKINWTHGPFEMQKHFLMFDLAI